MSDLSNMTQTKWDALTPSQRDALRSDGGLTKQLIGLEGWRVEVVSMMTGEKYRFIVGRSSGWVPCHIELRNRTSRGGVPASTSYASVTKISKVR
jgi:hypothetical protein